MKQTLWVVLIVACGSIGSGCGLTIKHSVPEPIHIKVDVNVRVQQELNDFFKDIDNQ